MVFVQYHYDLVAPLQVNLKIFETQRISTDDAFERSDKLKYRVKIGDQDVELELVVGIMANPAKAGSSWYWVNKILIGIWFKEEVTNLDIENILESISREGQNTALEAASRTIAFFKYELGQPFLDIKNSGHISLVKYFDELGNSIKGDKRIVELTKIPGERDDLDSILFGKKFTEEFINYVNHEVQIDLIDDVLSDAKQAIYENDVLKAVIFLAIVCEVSIKRTFFAHNSYAGEAFNYLEEKRKVEVSPVELIKDVAERAFGQSFKKYAPVPFEHIEYLFRCRNKVAHRAQPIYRDKFGELVVLEKEELIVWWRSVTYLLDWLNSHKE